MTPTRPRLRLMTRGLLLTLIGWLTLIAVGLWWHATWPQTNDEWNTLVVAIIATEYVALKAWMTARRAWDFDWLTATLVAANVMFGVIFLWLFVILRLWPHVRADAWSHDVTMILINLLAAIALFGIVQMFLIPDPPDEGGSSP